MRYMINVDLETKNVSGRETHCRSKAHEAHGRHYDLTVHELGCKYRRVGGTHRPTRYWDDGDGELHCRKLFRSSARFRLNMLTHTLGAAEYA